MQPTRQLILQLLRERGATTVDEIVAELHEQHGKDITAVTVRHHLSLLQDEELITSPELRRRTSPGRPQHLYTLTSKAHDLFPNNYERLALGMLQQIEQLLPPSSVNVIFEGIAVSMAAEANLGGLPLAERIVLAVDYLNDHGYDAHFSPTDEGYILYTRNCPYHAIAGQTHAVCDMDMRLVASLLGTPPRLLSRANDGDETCSYFVPNNADTHQTN
jgi:predicted ArsR family transcriptional regulator